MKSRINPCDSVHEGTIALADSSPTSTELLARNRLLRRGAELALAAALLAVQLAPAATLQEALDGPGLSWTTGGPSPWIGQANISQDGLSAAMCLGGSNSWLQTAVTGPGILRFSWGFGAGLSVGSIENALVLFIDGSNTVATLSELQEWDEITVPVEPGLHSLVWWAYDINDSEVVFVVDQVRFTLTGSPPVITSLPEEKIAAPGASVFLSVFAGGDPPLMYQWSFAGRPIDGATNSWWNVKNLQPESAGAYTVAVSNMFGQASATSTVELSSTAIATALDTPGWAWESGYEPFWLVTTNQSRVGGTSIQWLWQGEPSDCCIEDHGSLLATTLVGPGTLQFQWRQLCFPEGSGVLTFTGPFPENSRVLNTNSGWQQQTILLPAGTNSISWVCEIQTFLVGSQLNWLDDVRFVPGHTLPTITQQPCPTNVTLLPKLDAGWSVAADGTPPLLYQWRRNSSDLPNATDKSFSLSVVRPGDAGTYDVVIANAWGSVTSTPISVVVLPSPTNAQVAVTGMPPFGSSGSVSGIASNIVFSNYLIAGFLKVGYGGWWTKPYWATPLTALDPNNGTFSYAGVTGGIDSLASQYAVFLVPAGWSPPLLSGSQALPQTLFDHAEAYAIVSRGITTQPTIALTNPGQDLSRIVITSGQTWMWYAVQATDNLINPNWITLPGSTNLYVGSFDYDDQLPSGTTNRYYRVIYVP